MNATIVITPNTTIPMPIALKDIIAKMVLTWAIKHTQTSLTTIRKSA